MLRELIDSFMAYKATTIFIVLAHVIALIWAVGLRRGLLPVLGLNVIVAAGIFAYNASYLSIMLRYADYAQLALMAFAFATFIISTAALFGLQIPVALIWIAFGGNFTLSVVLMAFALLFKMNRLF